MLVVGRHADDRLLESISAQVDGRVVVRRVERRKSSERSIAIGWHINQQQGRQLCDKEWSAVVKTSRTEP